MSTTPAKKPAAAGVGKMSATDSTSPSRRGSTTPAPGTPASVTRTRSVRSGTPVSARGSVSGPRRESPLSTANVNGANGTSEAERERLAREELAAALDDVKQRLAKSEAVADDARKQGEVLQARLDDTMRENAKLEERLHETEEQIESLSNEKREAARQTREMESIYEAERSAMMKEKDEMNNREEEMQAVIQRLKESLAAHKANADEEGRSSRQSGPTAVEGSGSFAPPSSLHRSDSRNNSKLLLQKDKLIESLRLELAEAQIKLVEAENQGGGRIHEVERQLMEARMANARLMEDNESYQLLLQEKTLNGDFTKNDFSYLGGVGTSSNQDALMALEGRSPGASSTGAGGPGASSSLADELSEAAENESDNYRRLEAELRSAKDQNKALTLYINKIIERLLQHQDFEAILDQSSDFKPGGNTNKDLPPPPPEKDGHWSGAALLQRAKSVALGAGAVGAAKQAKPRPMSYMPAAMQGPTVHNDPETAPKIPIGNLTRSTSVRRTRPMSEQYTGAGGSGGPPPIGGSGLVNQMYKGPDGPGSPPLPLGSPRRSQTFFSHGGAAPMQRTPSGQQAPSSSSPAPTSGNFPGMRSETSSVSGESGNDAASATSPSSQSPPRTHTHHQHDKTTTFAGNKPRPLRLVQENPDSVKPENKRASWIGWAQSWAGKKEGENVAPPHAGAPQQQQQQQQQQPLSGGSTASQMMMPPPPGSASSSIPE